MYVNYMNGEVLKRHFRPLDWSSLKVYNFLKKYIQLKILKEVCAFFHVFFFLTNIPSAKHNNFDVKN